MFEKIKALFSVDTPQKDRPVQQPEDATALVAQRRVKRRVKAVVSVSLALGAGAFLSCQRMLGFEEEQKPEPPSPQSASTPAATPATAPTSTPESHPVIAPTSQLTTTTQPTPPAPHKKKSSTDKHRKGMPVLDNLLE